MFSDLYRMMDELHKAVEPIKERRRAAWDKLWRELRAPLDEIMSRPPVVLEYDFTIHVNRSKRLTEERR